MALTDLQEAAIRQALADALKTSEVKFVPSIQKAEEIYEANMVDRPIIESLIITGFILEQIQRNAPIEDEAFQRMIELVYQGCVATFKAIERREKEKTH